MRRLRTPLSKEEIRRLKIGDTIYLDGVLITFRDQAHKRFLEYKESGKFIPIKFEGSAIFHCGPIVKREKNKWKVLVAGPTTSIRMEAFTPELLRITDIRMIVGKGGMGKSTLEALKKYETVYCDFTGGAGVLGAKAVKRVLDVKWLDLGIPEAVWFLEVKKFGPLIVSMDSRGNDLREFLRKRKH